MGTYRCIAYPNELGGWSALCLDLDIAVDAGTPAEAQHRIISAVDDYLRSIDELPASERRDLLRRRVPWFVRARWGCLLLWQTLVEGENAIWAFATGERGSWAAAN